MANNDNELTTQYKWQRKAPLPQLRAPQPRSAKAKAVEEVPKDPYADQNYANVSGHSLLRQPLLPLKVPGLNPDTLITMGLFQNETEKPPVVGPAPKKWNKRKDGFEYAWRKNEGQNSMASKTNVIPPGMDNYRKSTGTNTQGSRNSRDSGSSRSKRPSNDEGRSHGSRSSGSHSRGRSGSYGGESGSRGRGSKGGESNEDDDVPAGASAHQHHHHRHQESHHKIIDLDDSSEDAEKKHKQHSHSHSSSNNNRHHHHRHHHRRSSSGGSSKRR